MKRIFVHVIELIYCLVELRLSFWNGALLWSGISFERVEFTVIGRLFIAVFRIFQLNFIRVNPFMWLVELRLILGLINAQSPIVVGVTLTAG